MAEKCLELKDIRKSFSKDEVVLKEISLSIDKGEFITLLGSSGCGKTTTLRIIAGLETPDSGKVYLEGKDVTALAPEARDVNTVFQNYALFPHMTVADNIGYGLKLKKIPKAEIKKRVSEMLELVQLPGYEKRKPSELSGGQRQRVAIARSLVNNPKVLLLDEPFAAIDAKIRQELRSWLKEMIGKLGITSIFVTHDQDEAIEVADEIIITNAGRIEQKGTPIGVYRNPETAFTASFFGQPSVLKNADDFHTFAQAEGADKIIVRPEFVKISKLDEVEKFKTSVSRGVVEQVSFRGDNLELQVRVNNSVVTARRSLEKADIREGETVNVFLYRIFALRGDSVQLIENEAVRDDFVII